MARWAAAGLVLLAAVTGACAGPYTTPGVNGYIDPATWRRADPADPNAILSPIFRAWASGVAAYVPADQTWSGPGLWNDPNMALGPATGLNFDIVSLGEVDGRERERGVPPGYITLTFGDPCDPNDANGIRNGPGYDFVVFENAFTSEITTMAGSFEGQMLAELAYVEVSSNGRDFARFPCVSLTPRRIGPYGTIEISDVYNLAGKHPNAHGLCTGTPFDLDELADHPLVGAGAIDLSNIRYVRLADVPGHGDLLDEASGQVDPATWPAWSNYVTDHPIYDAWATWGSGGFDLEAVGVLRDQQYAGDIDLDGTVDLSDLVLLAWAWQSHFGQAHWNARCDLAQPEEMWIDGNDFAIFAAQWRHTERWRAEFSTE